MHTLLEHKHTPFLGSGSLGTHAGGQHANQRSGSRSQSEHFHTPLPVHFLDAMICAYPGRGEAPPEGHRQSLPTLSLYSDIPQTQFRGVCVEGNTPPLKLARGIRHLEEALGRRSCSRQERAESSRWGGGSAPGPSRHTRAASQQGGGAGQRPGGREAPGTARPASPSAAGRPGRERGEANAAEPGVKAPTSLACLPGFLPTRSRPPPRLGCSSSQSRSVCPPPSSASPRPLSPWP